MPYKLKPIACAIALSLGVLASGAYASSPILSVSGVQTASSNLGTGATITTSGPSVSSNSNSWDTNFNTTTSSTLTREVITAPTTATAGLAYDYQTPTTTTTWDHQTWHYDNLNIDVISNGTNQSGDKWISLTGSVQSSVNTSLSFQLSASGNFTATQNPFGTTAPLLASFYFGSAQPTPLSATTSSNLDYLTYSTYSTSYSTTTFSLLAGVAQTFVAYVYAPNNVSVNDFQLSAGTSSYDFISTPNVTNSVGSKQLIGAVVLQPVPEPESYAMLLAGLGLMGFIARRRTQS
jgi:hypothetical protein